MYRIFIFLIVLGSCNYFSADQPLPQEDNQEQYRQYYHNGLVSNPNINDAASWMRAVDRFKESNWYRRADYVLGRSTTSTTYEVNVDAITKVFMRVCGIAASAAVTGGIGPIGEFVKDSIQGFFGTFTSLVGNGLVHGGSSSERNVGRSSIINHSPDYRYVIGYFCSFEQDSAGSNSPIHATERSDASCHASIFLFEIIHAPRIPRRILNNYNPSSLYRILPEGCVTKVYVALMDHHFPDLTEIMTSSHSTEGYKGWLQIVDTRDQEGNVVYTIRHYIKNRPGTSLSYFSSQEVCAKIEVLVGANYQALAQSLIEINSNTVQLSRRSSEFKSSIGDVEESTNRYDYWIKSCIVGMEMPEALSCEKVIGTIKDMIVNGSSPEKRFRYGAYGCSSVGRVINCVPWPFMFWERILGGKDKRVCNESMGKYLDFKMCVSPCFLEQGFEAFFKKDGKLVDKRMKLVEIDAGLTKHRLWQRFEQENGYEITGGLPTVYSFDWVGKARGHVMDIMEIKTMGVECFMA